MLILAAIGGGGFLLVSIIGGARLLLLARRTRELPEFVLGLGLFMMGGIGAPLGTLARTLPDVSESTRALLMAGQGLVLAIGFGGFALFTQRVFRREKRWAEILSWAIPLSLMASIGVMATEPDGFAKALLMDSTSGGQSLGFMGQQMIANATLMWTAWEALRYAMTLRRRLRLGLADPVVTNRIQLWGTAMAGGAAMAVAVTAGQLARVDLQTSAIAMTLLGGVGIVSGSSVYLAFLPPRFYTNWVVARSAAVG